MRDFHSRMMNIQVDRLNNQAESQGGPEATHDYMMGHKEARHAAAEIANEADTKITDLRCRLGRLEGVSRSLAEQRDETQKMLDHVADERDKLALQVKQERERYLG